MMVSVCDDPRDLLVMPAIPRLMEVLHISCSWFEGYIAASAGGSIRCDEPPDAARTPNGVNTPSALPGESRSDVGRITFSPILYINIIAFGDYYQ